MHTVTFNWELTLPFSFCASNEN
uniref:Uncharacterized protein n=1 Tax=Rhizophora mucronata TaxID=61149 RepID=A0A2P2PM89_RHIMU